MTKFVRSGLKFDHPWYEILWIWGLKPEDLGEHWSEFIAKHGSSTESADESDAARAWIFKNCTELRKRMVESQSRPVNANVYAFP